MKQPAKAISRGASKISSWHIGVAAEAIAAGQFARLGLDVSVQYGANQPEYDLIVTHGEFLLKVSVKGSQDGSWGLTQSYLKNADYQGAIDRWLKRHKRRTVLCFIQFKDVRIDGLPRMYLATPSEVAERMRESAGGRGDTVLFENHAWGPRARGKGTVDRIPEAWCFSEARIARLLTEA